MFYTGIYLRKLKRATLQGGHFLEWTAKLHFESIGRIPGHFSFSRFVEFEAEPPLWHAILSRKLRFDTQSALFAAHLLKGKKCKDKYTHDTNSLTIKIAKKPQKIQSAPSKHLQVSSVDFQDSRRSLECGGLNVGLLPQGSA